MLPGIPGKRPEEFGLVEGRADAEPPLIAESRSVSPSYFATMQIPLLSGECRRPVDVAAGREVMVNRSFAERYLPGRSAIGLHLTRANASARITGIVGDARELGLDRDPTPTVYDCYAASSPSPWDLIRTRGEPIAAALAVRSKVGDLEPFRPVYDIAPLGERIGRAYAEDRLRTVLLTLFSVAALVLAASASMER
jgi:putative ABC transport system permease protein